MVGSTHTYSPEHWDLPLSSIVPLNIITVQDAHIQWCMHNTHTLETNPKEFCFTFDFSVVGINSPFTERLYFALFLPVIFIPLLL